MSYEECVKAYEGFLEDEYKQMTRELSDFTSENYKKESEEIQSRNERPCDVCKHPNFINKFRDVQGEVHGRISGSFSLFGGGVSGYVDGNTRTLPVLCCRECGNERQIEILNYKGQERIYKNQFSWFNTEDLYDLDRAPNGWAKKYSLQTHLKYVKENRIKYFITCSNHDDDYYPFSDGEYIKAGFWVKERPKRLAADSSTFLGRIIQFFS